MHPRRVTIATTPTTPTAIAIVAEDCAHALLVSPFLQFTLTREGKMKREKKRKERGKKERTEDDKLIS